MGFEVVAFVPLKEEKDAKNNVEKQQMKTRVAIIRTEGPHRENHVTALQLMEALQYDIDERCPSAFDQIENHFTGEMEGEFEGCGEVLEYTGDELVAAAQRVEAADWSEDNKKAVLRFIDKTIEALEKSEFDSAEVGFF